MREKRLKWFFFVLLLVILSWIIWQEYFPLKQESGPLLLYKACCKGDLAAVKKLIEKDKVDVNCSTNFAGWTPLFFAVNNGNSEIVSYLLKKGADVNAVARQDQWTPLMMALRYGKSPDARLLIERGANIHARNNEDRTPLMLAVQYGKPDEVKLLIEKGADVNARTKYDWMPLMLAVKYGKPDEVQLLIEKGADVNARTKYDWTPLMLALRYGKPGNAQLLIEKGADVNAKGSTNWTPLMFALRYGKLDDAKLLIEKGADVNAREKVNWTPLMFALRYGKPGDAQLLIEEGADVNARTKYDWTPLMLALRYEKSGDAKLLIEKGADVNARNNGKWTPLMHALRYGKPGDAKLLIEKGADVNARNNNQWTPLMFALRYGKLENAELLISKGAYIHVKHLDVTALHLAAHYGNAQLVKLLLAKGADVNGKDWKECTPLLIACRWGNLEIARALIENGADIHARSRPGWTPYMYALDSGLTNLLPILVQKGANENRDLSELKENAAVYYARALDELQTVSRKKEKILRDSLQKQSKGKTTDETVAEFLEKNNQVLDIFQKGRHLRRCDFASVGLGNNWSPITGKIPVHCLLDDLSLLILLMGKYQEDQGNTTNAAALYTHFLTFLWRLSTVDSFEIKTPVLETTAELFASLRRYLELPETKRDKGICKELYRQLTEYENNIFPLSQLVANHQENFLSEMKFMGKFLEGEFNKKTKPDPDKEPEKAIKNDWGPVLIKAILTQLEPSAREVSHRYFGYYKKAAISNNPKDWQYADDQIKKIMNSLPVDKDGKMKKWPDDSLLFAEGKPSDHVKKYVDQWVNIMLVKRLTGANSYRESMELYNRNLEKLKQLKKLARFPKNR